MISSFLSNRYESSEVLHGFTVQSGPLQGDQVYGARADGSIPSGPLQCRVGRQAPLDSSVLSAIICFRLCHQHASAFAQRYKKRVEDKL